MNLGRKDFIDDLHTMFPVTKKNALYFFFHLSRMLRNLSFTQKQDFFYGVNFLGKESLGEKVYLDDPH